MNWKAQMGLVLLLVLGSAVAGWVAGRASVRPDESATASLAAAHAELRDSTALFHVKRDSLLQLVAQADAVADGATIDATRAAARARQADAQRVVSEAATDSALVLANAAGADVAGVRTALWNERASHDSARVAWVDQLEAEQRAGAALRVETVHLAELLSATEDRLTASQHIIDRLVHQVRGCRVFGVRCPQLAVGYGIQAARTGGLTDGLQLGVMIPLH